MHRLVPGIPETQANFVWLPLEDRSAAFAAACEARGVIVRPFQGDGVRVTIGTPAENDAFLTAAEAALT
ncbi:MAG: histidinol-phosphate aminotransferase, partial [Cryptosporangiaceae bacterium]|nr:histidinol-phosphate aminotransferase [Cryptosporangiaceae bacterium]